MFGSRKRQDHYRELLEEETRLREKLQAQDAQFQSIIEAENKYETNKNLDELLKFWENIWTHGGLIFNGSKWTFRLPDLYIKEKRYADALRILKKIKNPAYQDKKNSYIERVSKLKEKEEKKK